ncbi:MAG TPA: tRNA (guanosine(37)-N1)-methyltransferase TrmD [Opitutales bacterium]|nr:tRNA (guanosine(37)-N1)-methyltransferase TrmD [Opitutales bacterium]
MSLLKIDVLTLFPEMVDGYFKASMLGRAVENGILEIALHNIRDWSTDKHRRTDDAPFGGGAGMVMKPEPVFAAINAVAKPDSTVIYLCPDGELLTQKMSSELAQSKHLVLLSGHYEGIDERIRQTLVTREVSIGDYVLTNGTIAAAVLVDAVARYVPGVLGEEKSLTQDSFTGNLLSFPQYTRPVEYLGMRVPDVLLSGNHAEIERWREEQRRERTRLRRPDLLKQFSQSQQQ